MKTNFFRRYTPFIKMGILEYLAYKWKIVLWVISGLLAAAISALIWWAVYTYGNHDTIGGLTFVQMVAYLLFALIVRESAYSSRSDYEMAYAIQKGDIGIKLTKPINYRYQLMFSTIGGYIGKAMYIVLPYLVLTFFVLIFGFGYSIDVSLLWQLPIFMLSTFIGVMVIDGINFLYGQLAFVTTALFGITQIVSCLISFLSGGIVPLSVMPSWVQTVLSFTPFPYIVSYPILILLGQVGFVSSIKVIGIQLAWVAVFELIGALVFKQSIKRVVAVGG